MLYFCNLKREGAMPLDLSQLWTQVERMTQDIGVSGEEREKRLLSSLQTLRGLEVEPWRRKFKRAKTTWLVAGIESSPSSCCKLPSLPRQFSVLGADGSHIDVDRHSFAHCYLLNLGVVRLDYGPRPDAFLASYPLLFSRQEELVLTDPQSSRREAIEGVLLGVKRSVEECRYLLTLSKELPPDQPALALLDGSLILWGLAGQAYPDFVRVELLDRGFLPLLEEMRKLSQERKLALASYISYPRSTEVVNALRIALCPYDPVNCDRHCSGKDSAKARACDGVVGLQDRELFGRLLAPGERSALFLSLSSIVKEHYGEHAVRFFYIRVADEIARVEVPGWVAARADLLDLVHALVWDQCQRGQGYPVALSEAHEKAVVTAADRELFWQLVEQSLAEKHLPQQTSAKSRSKRTKWV